MELEKKWINRAAPDRPNKNIAAFSRNINSQKKALELSKGLESFDSEVSGPDPGSRRDKRL